MGIQWFFFGLHYDVKSTSQKFQISMIGNVFSSNISSLVSIASKFGKEIPCKRHLWIGSEGYFYMKFMRYLKKIDLFKKYINLFFKSYWRNFVTTRKQKKHIFKQYSFDISIIYFRKKYFKITNQVTFLDILIGARFTFVINQWILLVKFVRLLLVKMFS